MPPRGRDERESSRLAVAQPDNTLRTDQQQRQQQQPQQSRRRSSSHIPRPPNAFILFRSSFIRSNHVPGKVEGNHSTLSKIIGLCWKALPPQERRSWEEKARIAQAEHRTLYPDWRWRPEANSLGKKRAPRKRRRNLDDEDNDNDDSQDDPDSSLKPKGKEKGKGKARDRSHDSDEIEEDVRVAKIADLVKQGKTGAELEKALEEWELTRSTADSRPLKKRRIQRKHCPPSPPEPSSSSHSRVEGPSPKNSPLQPSPSAPPALPPSVVHPPDPPLIHVFRRSPSDPAHHSDLARLTTESVSVITHDSSHTPSPHTPFYNSHPPLETHSQPLPTITWSQTTTPASFPPSQPSYSQWWPSDPSAASSSPFGNCYDPPEITTAGLGYEEDGNFDQGFSDQFNQMPQSQDGSERVQWARNTGRHGLCTVISDPLPVSGGSPTSRSPTAFPPPSDIVSPPPVSPTMLSASSCTSVSSFFGPDGNISPVTPTAFVPSTYSSLTGWAGEYADHPGLSLNPSLSTDWYNQSWQSVPRHSTWSQESDNVDRSRPNPESSHHKIPYQDPTLPLELSSSVVIRHQSDSNSPQLIPLTHTTD